MPSPKFLETYMPTRQGWAAMPLQRENDAPRSREAEVTLFYQLESAPPLKSSDALPPLFPKKLCARHEAAARPFHEVRVLVHTTLHHLLNPDTPAFDLIHLSITHFFRLHRVVR